MCSGENCNTIIKMVMSAGFSNSDIYLCSTFIFCYHKPANVNNKSAHILNTSSNLLGICFIVLTSLQVLKLKQTSLIDEFTAVATVSFMLSSLLSFLSLRSKNDNLSEKYENFADFIFMTGLSVLFITTMVITFDIVK